MNDFRLRAFIAVAENLSFTKASRELMISQPAVSKHIQEIETLYGVQLFERCGSAVRLTAAGGVFLQHAYVIVDHYHTLKLEMNLLSGNFEGTLRIGASTTIAQYVIPEIIAKFIPRFTGVKISLATGNTEQIEQMLSDHKIDIGLVEGGSRNRDFHYSLFAKDELVLVTSVDTNSSDEISLEELVRLPLVLRENGSGTLEVIERALANHNLRLSDLNIMLQLGGTESIKQFLKNSAMYAIVSIVAVAGELLRNKLKVVDVSEFTLEREFSYILPMGSRNEAAHRFIEFANLYYNKKL